MLRITPIQQQNMRATGAPPPRHCGRTLTTDRKEGVGLLALHRRHTLQSTEPSPADIHPTLHLRLPEPWADQCDGDDVLLLHGGIHLLGAPEGRRLYNVDKRLTGSRSFLTIVTCQVTYLPLNLWKQDTHSFPDSWKNLSEVE